MLVCEVFLYSCAGKEGLCNHAIFQPLPLFSTIIQFQV